VKKLHDLTVLYVEDDAQTQEKMQMLLEDEIKELHQAFNAKDALDLYYKVRPDIVLTDINMPYMDGLNFAQKIKEIDEEQPIIIISAYDNKDNLLKSINIGVDQFLQKPIDMQLLFQKIEKSMQKRERIKEKTRMAYSDTLTGINNRYYFDKIFEDMIKKVNIDHKILTLIFIDLDNFRLINDVYGHHAGDMILKKVVSNIQKVLGKNDVLARIGGDEFAIIKETDDTSDLEEFAQKLLDVTHFMIEFEVDSSLFDSNKELVCITCSIGICSSKEHNDKETLLKCVDETIYKIKHSGKANYQIEFI
jgi:diguanylate cyclase (GGDEF)-like protein